MTKQTIDAAKDIISSTWVRWIYGVILAITLAYTSYVQAQIFELRKGVNERLLKEDYVREICEVKTEMASMRKDMRTLNGTMIQLLERLPKK